MHEALEIIAGMEDEEVASDWTEPASWTSTSDTELRFEQIPLLENLYNVVVDTDGAEASMIVYDKKRRYIGSVTVSQLAPGVWVGFVVRAIKGEDVDIIVATRAEDTGSVYPKEAS